MDKTFTKLFSLISNYLLVFLCFYCISANAQTPQRIKVISIKSSINVGQDYSPWLNDDVTSLVQDVWQNNFVWADVTLQLSQRSAITSLSFYDYTGVFSDAPDTIYALDGAKKTFLGTFIGPGYMIWDGFTLAAPVEADAIVIHKYSNNIPQKVDIFGIPDSGAKPAVSDTTTTPTPPVTTPTPPANTDTIAGVKIPIDPARWYQLNNVSNGLDGLFDGNLTAIVNTGYGKIFDNFDAYYPVLPGERIDLTAIKFYSYEGGLGPYPLTVSVIDSTGTRTKVATYIGGQYETWQGPDTGKTGFNLDNPMRNIKYIVINAWAQYPTEMEFYGTYTAPADTTPVVKKAYPLSQYFGANAFEWNFEDPNNATVVNAQSLTAMKSFTQIRHYMDWNKLESTQGEYTYNPVHSGGWNYDAMYNSCSNNNIFVLADLKCQPDWMIATYPADQQDSENVPVVYGKDFSDPNSYIEQAKVAFQYAARYGSNSAVKTSLLSVDPTSRWTDDPVNKVKKNLQLIQYIECDNERDKWWKGRRAYQTCYEYAANLSAFYDGNKNTMGPGVGVKNADPNMQVVMGGLASADPAYVHGMIEWCKQHRGYKADGSVNLCWDVINYHYYSNDAAPGGYATTGVAPELSGTMKTAQAFLKMAHQYAGDMPVWVTEAGYDNNTGSPQRAPAIGSKTALIVEADWELRTALLYARAGISRLFFYEAYDDNPDNPTQYASSGLLNADKSRKPAALYLYQVNKQFGGFSYVQTLSSNPMVDKYQDSIQQMYVLTIPDQVGRTANYSLNLGNADSAYVYRPNATKTTMNLNAVKVVNGKITVAISETPTFVVPVGTAAIAVQIKAKAMLVNNSFNNSISVFPNPTAKFVTVAFNNDNAADVTIKVTDVNMGRVYKNYTVQKPGADFSNTIDISSLPMGMCVVQVIQGNKSTMKKVIKVTN